MTSGPSRALRGRALRRGLRLSVLDGMAYALMVGVSETYFLADALRLGAGVVEQALVVGLPLFIGGLGPLAALLWLARASSSGAEGQRRRVVVAGAVLQSLALTALSFADATGLASPASTIALVSLHQVFGQAAGTAWSSWYGDLVPARIRGRYFAARGRAVHASTCLGIFLAGALLHVLEPASGESVKTGQGFAVIFALAAGFRLISTALLRASPEPRFEGVASAGRMLRALSTHRGGIVRRLILTFAGLHFGVYLAAAYFTPFMLGELSFTYMEYTLASLSVVAAKILLLPLWGRWIDRRGPARIFPLTLMLIGLVPLPWVIAEGLSLIVLGQVLSGFAWGGCEVAQFAMLLTLARRRHRAGFFALQSISNGVAQLSGSAVGALLAVGAGLELRTIFAFSALARLFVALGSLRLLPGTRQLAAPARERLAFRLVGFRPGGGAILRPIGDPKEPKT